MYQHYTKALWIIITIIVPNWKNLKSTWRVKQLFTCLIATFNSMSKWLEMIKIVCACHMIVCIFSSCLAQTDVPNVSKFLICSHNIQAWYFYPRNRSDVNNNSWHSEYRYLPSRWSIIEYTVESFGGDLSEFVTKYTLKLFAPLAIPSKTNMFSSLFWHQPFAGETLGDWTALCDEIRNAIEKQLTSQEMKVAECERAKSEDTWLKFPVQKRFDWFFNQTQ